MAVVASIILAIGPYAGFVALGALLMLTFLYVRQARYLSEIRRIRGIGPGEAPGPPAEISIRRLPGAPSRKPAISPKLTYVVIATAILVGLAVGSVSLLSGGGGSRNAPSSSKPAPAAAPATGRVDPSTLTVALLNGTSTVGLAVRTGQTLQAAGFGIGTTTNAAVTNVERSQVLRIAGQDAAAQTVARQLGIAQIVDADSVSKTIAGSADVIVLVGSDRQ